MFETDNAADTTRRNPHPTVKPTALMEYLCKLVTPPSGKVLDPFTGGGSTGRGAVLGGYHFVGIERESLSLSRLQRLALPLFKL